MTSKERMLLALAREKPDRLPVSVHQWQSFHLQTFMDGMSDLEAFRAVGMDAQIQYFESMAQFWLADADFTKLNTPEWRDAATIVSADPDHRVVHHEIETPGGRLTYKSEGDRKTTWITEYLIKRDDDLDLIERYMPVPKLDLPPCPGLMTPSETPGSSAASSGATRPAAGSMPPASWTSARSSWPRSTSPIGSTPSSASCWRRSSVSSRG